MRFDVIRTAGVVAIVLAAVACGQPIENVRPVGAPAAADSVPPSSVEPATPTSTSGTPTTTVPAESAVVVESSTTVALAVSEDPCLRQFREYPGAERIVEAPVEVEIHVVENMFLIDAFQNGLWVIRGCTDMFSKDPEGVHAVVVSSDETVYVVLSTLGSELRWTPRQDSVTSEVIVDETGQTAVFEYFEISRSSAKASDLPNLPGADVLVRGVVGIEPQTTKTIALSSTAEFLSEGS